MLNDVVSPGPTPITEDKDQSTAGAHWSATPLLLYPYCAFVLVLLLKAQ